MTPLQLEIRIQELLEGTLKDEHWPELQEALHTSEKARQLYCQHARISSLLRLRSKGIKSLAKPTAIIPIDEILENDRKKTVKLAFIAAAALMVITLISMKLLFSDSAKPEHHFAVAPGSAYVVSHENEDNVSGRMVLEEGSRLQLSRGSIEVRLSSGVRSVIQAPADVTLHADDTLYLKRGVAWFHVPREAVGFRVKTTELDIVDLGTEFGVVSSLEDQDEVHVFKGRVQVTANRVRRESVTLTANEARRIDHIGLLKNIPARPLLYLTTLPQSWPYLHWSFDGRDNNQLTVQGDHPHADKIATNIVNDKRLFSSVEGKFSEGLKSLGKEGYVETNWPGISGNAPRTISYWLRIPPDATYNNFHVVGWGNYSALSNSGSTDYGVADQFYSFVQSSEGKTYTGLSLGGFWVTGSTPIADGEWHHIVHSYTGNSDRNGDPEIYSYVDGKLEAAVSSSWGDLRRDEEGNVIVDTVINGVESKPLSLFVLSWDNERKGYSYTPSIDELFIFNLALSKQQVANLYRFNNIHADD